MPDTNDQRLILTIYVIRNTIYHFVIASLPLNISLGAGEAISSTYARIFSLKTVNCKLKTIYHPHLPSPL